MLCSPTGRRLVTSHSDRAPVTAWDEPSGWWPGGYIRKGWSSTNPDSYSHYKQGREHERKQAERGRKAADRSAELDREEVQRGREYEERYAAERAAEEPQTESPRDDTQPERSRP